MTANIDSLRPHFDQITERWWELTKFAHEIYPQLVPLSYWDVLQAVDNLLGPRPNVVFKYQDHEYTALPRHLLSEVLHHDRTDLRMVRPDLVDCDNFALQFKASMDYWFNWTAVGYVHDETAWHAYNLLVFADKTAVLLEPQRDLVVRVDGPINLGVQVPPPSSGFYDLGAGLVLL